nr:AraC family transcriptional regulator [Planctomycetota bacterium]
LVWDGGGESCIHRSDPRHPFSAFLVTVAFAGPSPRTGPRISHWPGAWREFTDHVLAAWTTSQPERDETGRLAYQILRFQALAWAARQSHAAWPRALERSVATINQHPQRDLGVTALAAAARISPGHLHELFKQHLGTSPHQYILARRLDRARRLLRDSNASIATIAHDCGFASAANFCRAFKRITAMSPGSYRRLQYG